eukprot:Protomagalhaensia_sp_Gyna_25__449@NODE_1210_length_2067_cov_575_761341_g963_i0_p2_GENE_NODE_1210_length_2067_cov_575_761341_g963_i0NODE_1210_length_2067_cov_575_761341_g963_i0_p2_ORF_typecomplete_len192_score38_22_NODE_1210_length_2067_cov_575_761341_g963_i072578
MPVSAGLPATVVSVIGQDQIAALQQAATAALPGAIPAARRLATNHTLPLYGEPRPRKPSDDAGIFTSESVLESACQRQLASVIPKVTLDDLKRFKDMGKPLASKSKTEAGGGGGSRNSTAKKLSSFFGMEEEEQIDDSMYSMLWTRMEDRLLEAQRVAEDRVKSKFRQ